MIINAAKGDIQFVRKRTFHISALENEQNEQKKVKKLRYKLQQRCHCHVTYWSPIEGGLGTYKISPVISSVSHTLKCHTKCACVHASALAHYFENVCFFRFFCFKFLFCSIVPWTTPFVLLHLLTCTHTILFTSIQWLVGGDHSKIRLSTYPRFYKETLSLTVENGHNFQF